MELNFKDYIQQVENILNEETILKIAGQVKTLGKFQKSASGEWKPIFYSGFTIITPTSPDDRENAGLYKKLDDIGKEMFREQNFPQIMPAPACALHMTIARLISGQDFAAKLMNCRETEFLLALNQVFSRIDILGPLKYEVKGISIFPDGVVAAIVSPATENDYRRLQAFRDHIYADKILAELGVERKRGFHGHITLHYIEEDLLKSDRENLAGLIININKEYFRTPMPYIITRAEVRKFNNFLNFDRRDGWPGYKF